MAERIPFALKDTPALIESVFPAQKISCEAQRERNAGKAQTLPALGSYWKGRKPLILVRAIILGSLLPQTDQPEQDLEIFEMLMAFDDQSLAKRALVQNTIKARDIAAKIELHNPWDYFTHNIGVAEERFSEVEAMAFPIENLDSIGLKLQWRCDIEEEQKLDLLALFLGQMQGYEKKAILCKRPEELDQEWLYANIWPAINRHYEAYGISAFSHRQLVEQFGLLRYGRRPRVGDSFAGGGSIPYEAARLGCDSYASDLNPVACMLSWGAKNIVGSEYEKQIAISEAQDLIIENVGQEIAELAIEKNGNGDLARMFLYCIEVVCPETGWSVPLLPTFVVSTRSNYIAKLSPNYREKRFEIAIVACSSKQEMLDAKKGTVQEGALVYELDEKLHRIPIKTLRGDYRDSDGIPRNRLRSWEKTDFQAAAEDIYRERLYAIQWIKKGAIKHSKGNTYFSSVTDADIEREQKVYQIVSENIEKWQAEGRVPDMVIELGYNTDEPIRTRGWSYWHQLFSPRQLLVNAMVFSKSSSPESRLLFARILDFNSKLTTWVGPSNCDKNNNTFAQQKLSPLFNRAERAWSFLRDTIRYSPKQIDSTADRLTVENLESSAIDTESDLWITDPPYADAVNYHEITEFFIAWLRKNPPKPFDEWIWDSRRALAIKGRGDDFRTGMVKAYRAMTEYMPDNGMQCVMFTHQDSGVWSDMVGIFWAAGLQVVGAWYIATETTSELKKGGYVQGTVILMLRKRPAGENAGFKQHLLPAVRSEVQRQIETMMQLNVGLEENMGESVFNDSDLQMAGYAAALKVLTSYTHIGGEDVTEFALRPRTKGKLTVVDEIVQQAAEAANSLLVPEGLRKETWQKLCGIQRFYCRMMDMESSGAAKLDNYQNFAKAFRVENYAGMMASMAANKAQLKRIPEFAARELNESNGIGPTWLGHLIVGIQQLLAEQDPLAVLRQLQGELPDFMEIRPLLIDLLCFIGNTVPEKSTHEVAELLAARLRNMPALGQ